MLYFCRAQVPAVSAQLSSLQAPSCLPGGLGWYSVLLLTLRICRLADAKTLPLPQEVMEWGCLEPAPCVSQEL